MANAEIPPAGELAPDAATASVPAEMWTQEDAPTRPEPAPAADSPFRDDQLLFFEGDLMRNELADAQSEPDAARSLAARHWSRLLYDPNRAWRGQLPYPQISVPKKQGR